MKNQHLVINGVFQSTDEDETSKAFSLKSKEAVSSIPLNLKDLDNTKIGFLSKWCCWG